MKRLKAFFYSLKRSLFDTEYYKDILKTNFWFSFKYLLFLFFIIGLIRGVYFTSQYIKFRPNINPGINKAFNLANSLYPKNLELKVRNGKLSTNVQEPYVYNIEKPVEKNLLVIDTQGLIDNYPEYNSYILATKNAVIYPSKTSDNDITQTSVFYFKDLKKDFTLNEKVFNNFLKLIKPYTAKAVYFVDWFVFIFMFIFIFFGPFVGVLSTLFGLLFLTVFVWLINLIFKKGYQYSQLFRMGMHSVTAPIILVEMVKIFKLPFHGFYSFIFILWMIIIVFSNNIKLVNHKKSK